MSEKSGTTVYKGGVSLLTVVGVVFIILKLCEVQPIAKWSWWWVTLPIWIQPLLVIAALALLAVVFIAAFILSKK